MTDPGGFLLFLGAALVVAMTPGPGILYVAARSLAGGRAEGIASSFGTGLGGSVHILAGAVGVSALLLASAEAFAMLKLAGAAYLVWLGLRTLREARRPLPMEAAVPVLGARRAFREGVLVEALNPKTAAFFLAFVPQFVDPAAATPVALQFALLGLVSVTLNTGVDVLVAFGAGRARSGLAERPGLVRRLREVSGGTMIALGAALAFARRPA
jgi:threonine/homoserine/homoserine lactone efflux protein